MQNPVDYPVSEESGSPPEGPITVALLFDLHEAKQPITEEMIRSATQNLEAAHQLPFAARPQTIDSHVTTRTQPEPVLDRLLKVIR